MVEITTDTKNADYDGRSRYGHSTIKVFKKGMRFLKREWFPVDNPLEPREITLRLLTVSSVVSPSWYALVDVLKEVEPVSMVERVAMADIPVHMTMAETLDLLERNGISVDLGEFKRWQDALYEQEEADRVAREEG